MVIFALVVTFFSLSLVSSRSPTGMESALRSTAIPRETILLAPPFKRRTQQVEDKIAIVDNAILNSLLAKVKGIADRKRFNKCMEKFQNFEVCTGSSPYFVWAQLQAHRMMNP